MKVSVAALVFVLSTACCSQSSIEEKSFAMSSGIVSDCCFTYTSRKIPRGLVADYFVTSSVCAQPAVVAKDFLCAPIGFCHSDPYDAMSTFITKKDHKICTNPKDAWVQKYMNDLK